MLPLPRIHRSPVPRVRHDRRPNGGIYTITFEGTIAHFTTDSAGAISYAGCVTAGSTPGCVVEGVPAAMHGMTDIAASPDGHNLYVSTSSALLTFGLTAAGTPVFERCIATHIAGCSAVRGVQLETFEGVAVSPDGSAVYAIGTEPQFVVRFSRTQPSSPGGAGGPAGGEPEPGHRPGGPPHKPVFCDGRRATIVGTAGKDRLRGTKHADVIAGLAGNDTIEGLGGNDIICGGPGNDRLLGGAGNDRLDGEAGNDSLAGQAGGDVLRGGAGNDKLEGGAGNDRLLGQAGRDTLLGGAGNDRLEGGPGKDKLSGGAGHNSLRA